MRISRFFSTVLALWLGAAAPGASAQTLAQPANTVILEVSSATSAPNSGPIAQFDLALLDALPQRETVTSTPWYDGPQTFSGPLLSDLLDTLSVQGTTVRAVAINDYAVDIPVSDLLDYPVILASRHNGNLMSVRDKGPLFVVFPFDEVPSLNNEVYYARSAWQVRRIEVLP